MAYVVRRMICATTGERPNLSIVYAHGASLVEERGFVPREFDYEPNWTRFFAPPNRDWVEIYELVLRNHYPCIKCNTKHYGHSCSELMIWNHIDVRNTQSVDTCPFVLSETSLTKRWEPVEDQSHEISLVKVHGGRRKVLKREFIFNNYQHISIDGTR